MDNMFARLKKFGLSDVAQGRSDIFEPEIQENSESHIFNKEKSAPFNIENYVYAKRFNCPVCEANFTANVVKESRLRVQTVEFDLHPVCQYINPNFYDVIVCSKCGYGAVKNYFYNITERQASLILKDIAPNYIAQDYPAELDIDMAIERYELALLCSLVKNARDGEKAYICLKLMWFHKLKGDEENQKRLAKLTLQGFTSALAKEDLPIMGLQGDTITYLLGALYKILEDKASALKYLSNVVVSRTASDRLKDKARDLKDTMKD